MNTRERYLLIALLAILGGGVLLLGTFQWFIKPLREIDRQIAEMRDKRDESQRQLEEYEIDKLKLMQARARSLPADHAEAVFQYLTVYLKEDLLSNLKDPAARKTQVKDMPFTPTIPGARKVGHQVMTFTVIAKGDLGQFIQVLEKMQRKPYEHRIRTLSIERDVSPTSKEPNPKLKLNMTIETLLLSKGAAKQGPPPDFDLSSVIPENRKYGDITRKNIFAGPIPPPPPKPPIVKQDPPKPKKIEPLVNVPAYVRLDQITADQQVAYLRNIVYREPEKRLIAKEGYDTFMLKDDDTGYVFFRAKVLRIDPRAVYFQIKDEIYCVTMGMNLADATKKPLTEKQITEFQLTDLYDDDWAEQEMSEDKASTKKKAPPPTTKKKGPGKTK